ncbi:hypothetical protein M1M98_02675 [Thermodesulfovibrionales bacterium]|nr:hypothetical protein [Thermodesulfovibrionales bacterium]MCL0047156.1 hypothetical protein [Thermodesulfovibrionales bacterium]MCL0066882.1 hypothetical protein [Thermodesulfovibrionales bacterium]
MKTDISRLDPKICSYCDLVSPVPLSDMAHPGESKAIVEGEVVDEEVAMHKVAEKVLRAKKPVIFSPARTIMWAFEEGAVDKARVIRKLAQAIDTEILPVFDIRPEFPTVKSAVEINPYHADLVIEHNRYDVAIFTGIDCLYADVALKIIRAGSTCYTIALCGHSGHVDAEITMRDMGPSKLNRLIEIISEMKRPHTPPS